MRFDLVPERDRFIPGWRTRPDTSRAEFSRPEWRWRVGKYRVKLISNEELRPAPSREKEMQRPLVIMSETQDGKVEIALAPPNDERLQTYPGFVSLVCELVRHIAGAFDVPEEKVWASVERERVVALRRERQVIAHDDAWLSAASRACREGRM